MRNGEYTIGDEVKDARGRRGVCVSDERSEEGWTRVEVRWHDGDCGIAVSTMSIEKLSLVKAAKENVYGPTYEDELGIALTDLKRARACLRIVAADDLRDAIDPEDYEVKMVVDGLDHVVDLLEKAMVGRRARRV